MDNPAKSFLLIIYEVAIIASTIWPNLSTFAMFLTTFIPLTFILNLRWESRFRFLRYCLTRCLNETVTFCIVPLESAQLNYS